MKKATYSGYFRQRQAQFDIDFAGFIAHHSGV
jgi:hypothetical protein